MEYNLIENNSEINYEIFRYKNQIEVFTVDIVSEITTIHEIHHFDNDIC